MHLNRIAHLWIHLCGYFEQLKLLLNVVAGLEQSTFRSAMLTTDLIRYLSKNWV